MSKRRKPMVIAVYPRAVTICVRAALRLSLPPPTYGLVYV